MHRMSKLLRASDLVELLGVSRVTLWRWERSGQMPSKRQLGPNVVGWLESEIEQWWRDRMKIDETSADDLEEAS